MLSVCVSNSDVIQLTLDVPRLEESLIKLPSLSSCNVLMAANALSLFHFFVLFSSRVLKFNIGPGSSKQYAALLVVKADSSIYYRCSLSGATITDHTQYKL